MIGAVNLWAEREPQWHMALENGSALPSRDISVLEAVTEERETDFGKKCE